MSDYQNSFSSKVAPFLIGLVHSIAFLLILFPLDVKANSFVINPADIQAIESSFGTLESLSQMQYGIVPVSHEFYSSSVDVFNADFLMKNSHTSISSDDFVVVEDIPLEVIIDIADGKYGTLGPNNSFTPIYSLSEVQYVSFDNGFYSGHCLVQDGNILYTLDSEYNPSRACDVKIGGSECSVSEYKSALASYSDDVRYNLYNYGGTSGQNYSYYLCIGMADNAYNPEYCESVFISNQYIPGLIVPDASSSGEWIQSWYCNDLNLIQDNIILGESRFDIIEGLYSVGGYTYDYLVRFWGNRSWENYSNSIDGSISDLFDGVPYNNPVIGAVGGYFSTSLLNDAIPFYPVDGDVIDLDDSYALDDIIAYPLPDAQDFIHKLNYDPTLPVSATNFPIAIEVPEGVISDPVVRPIEIEDIVIEPIDPPVPIPEYDPSVDGFSIPFISGLSKKFPFCVPFDLAKAVKLLAKDPLPPAWDFNWKINFCGYQVNYHCVGDLSDFNELARVLRILQFCSALIGLAYFSYKQFF